MLALGDFNTGTTVRCPFNTHAVAGESITIGTNGTIAIYKDSSTTERSSGNGVTFTEDHDGHTGTHFIAIDLSDNTDSGFYAAGSTYFIKYHSATIDGKAVSVWLGWFSIERVNKVNVTQNAGTSITASGGRQEVNVSHVGGSTTPVTNLGVVFNTDFATNYDTSLDMWKVSVNYWRSELVQNSFALQSVILGANTVNASALATDAVTEIVTGVWQSLIADHDGVAGSFGEKAADWASQTDLADIATDVDNLGDNVASILGDTNELQQDWANGGRLDLILDARASQSSVDTLAGYVDTEVAAIKAKTDNLPASPAAVGSAMTLGTDAITAASVSAAAANKVADHVRRRTQANVEASTDGDTLSLKSEYGAIQQMQNSNTTDTPGSLTVKKTNGDALGTLTAASDSAAEPITGVS